MSGWGFLSKAEGFLDRVLDEQSKDKDSAKNLDSEGRTGPLTGRWQERLTRAASQFTSQESLPSLIQPNTFVSEKSDRASQSQVVQIAPNQSSLAEKKQIPHESLTELQRSATFPATLPSRLPSEQKVPTISSSNENEAPRISSTSKSADNQLSTTLESSKSSMLSVFTDQTETPSYEALLQLVQTLRADLQVCEDRRLEELQSGAERISALEARLSYFSIEQVAANREAAKISGATAEQKLLAEKDERIALLLEEGDNLSKREILNLANIKRLRARVSDLEGLIATSLKAVEKADDEGTTMKRENKNLIESLKRAEARIKELSKVETEIADLKRTNQTQAKYLTDLKRQLADADDTISQNVTIWTKLQAEKSKTDSLQKQIVELGDKARDVATEHQSTLEKLQGQFDRSVERARLREEEKDSEIAKLESELELLRATLEETTSGAAESSQTKLLRQIEALQTQQALARQNWARIEESLMMRCKHAENERDELRLQEEDLRQRLRQGVLDRKIIEEERSGYQARCRDLEGSIKDCQDRIGTLEKTIEAKNAKLEIDHENWLAEKDALEANIELQVRERMDIERRTHCISLPQTPNMEDSRSIFSFQKHIVDSPNSRTPEKVVRPGIGSRMSTQTSRMPSRRKISSTHLLDEMQSPPIGSQGEDPYSPIDNLGNLKAPTEVSVSTTSAGASVGLMERVAANVRKLELETNILREDLARMTRQRNDARDECVELESQAQRHKQLEQSLNESLQANKRLQDKFDASLELLGEQTEENDQLKEDIQDMKAAFRETLQSSLNHQP